MHRAHALQWVAVLTLLLPAAALGQEPPAKPKVEPGDVGPGTRINGPIDKDGFIDYEAAVNARLSEGISPDQNANVLIWKALGPTPDGEQCPAEYFMALGITPPPERGQYFVDLNSFAAEQLKLDSEAIEKLQGELQQAYHRSWASNEFPQVAQWLDANAIPLAVIHEATQRQFYFNPQIAPRNAKESRLLLAARLPSVHKCRALASALTARAMRRCADKRYDDAWQDLIACYRLGRLVCRGATMIETVTGTALQQLARNAMLEYLQSAPLKAAEIQQRLRDVQGLGTMSHVAFASNVDFGGRSVVLDTAQFMRSNAMLGSLVNGKPNKPNPQMVKALETLDWPAVVLRINGLYDRLTVAAGIDDRAAREQAFRKIEQEIKDWKEETSPTEINKQLQVNPEGVGPLIGKAIGNHLIALTLPDFAKLLNALDRSEQQQRNLIVAFALAAFRRETGHYPNKLDELVPRFLPALPSDLFSGRSLVYRLQDQGYLLYSVGVNGKDEEGRSADDDPAGDDLPVRMPLPEWKPKK